VWFLETSGVLTEFQSGFRKQCSTTERLVQLESFIREALVRREHVVAVFLDLEKAYDTTWKHRILRDMHSTILRVRLPQLIQKFLWDHQLRVRVGSCLSDAYSQEMGVQQGSILSSLKTRKYAIN
jgi:Reverse transcriptase (RNA-dependent DNA polymerase)